MIHDPNVLSSFHKHLSQFSLTKMIGGAQRNHDGTGFITFGGFVVDASSEKGKGGSQKAEIERLLDAPGIFFITVFKDKQDFISQRKTLEKAIVGAARDPSVPRKEGVSLRTMWYTYTDPISRAYNLADYLYHHFFRINLTHYQKDDVAIVGTTLRYMKQVTGMLIPLSDVARCKTVIKRKTPFRSKGRKSAGPAGKRRRPKRRPRGQTAEPKSRGKKRKE